MKLKKTIKRIAALGTSATMLGATILGATAASLSDYPSMFIKDGKFNGLIVIGDDAKSEDVIGATDIISSLQAVAVGGSTNVKIETVGDVYQFAKSSDKLNMGNSLATIKATVNDDELPIVLADGTLRTAGGNEYDFEQEITFPAAPQHIVEVFSDKDYKDEEPTTGIRIPDGMLVLQYSLDFKDDAESDVDSNDDWEDFEDRSITLLGEEFDIIGSDDSDKKLEVMRGAIKDSIEEGETKTYTINGKEYEVTALVVDDTNNKVKFKINGEVTDSMVEGDIYKTADGTNLGVREVLPNEAGDVTQDLVEFYIGAKKIVLKNGNEVELDGEDVDNLDVGITTGNSGNQTTIQEINLNWTADDDLFITEDSEVVLPGLESIKIYMSGFTQGAEELTEFTPNGDDTFAISTSVKDYDVNLDILFDTGNDGDWDITGSDTNNRLLAQTAGNFTVDMDTDEWFIVTRITGEDGESHILEVSRVDGDDGVTVKSYDGDTVASDKKLGDDFDVGDITLQVGNYSDVTKNVSFAMTSNNGANYTIVSKEGLKIGIPSISSNGTFVNYTGGTVNTSINTLAFRVEAEDKDDNIGSGAKDVLFSAAFDSDGDATTTGLVETSVFSGNDTFEIGDTDKFVGQTDEDVSIKVVNDQSGDQEKIEVTYPGAENYADIFIGSKASSVKSAGSGESVEFSKIEVGAAVLDTTLTSYTDKNLIVVGGPAVNKAAAALLGKTYPAYGAESGVPENAAIIKLVENAGNSAIIVAGWEAADTRRASIVLAEAEDYDLSGMEVKVTGTSFTDIKVAAPTAATATA